MQILNCTTLDPALPLLPLSPIRVSGNSHVSPSLPRVSLSSIPRPRETRHDKLCFTLTIPLLKMFAKKIHLFFVTSRMPEYKKTTTRTAILWGLTTFCTLIKFACRCYYCCYTPSSLSLSGYMSQKVDLRGLFEKLRSASKI